MKFKAIPLDKKIFEQGSIITPRKDKHVTEAAPFNFKTDERLKSLKSEGKDDSDNVPAIPVFKARAMPNYKFFEVKHHQPDHEAIVFKEFNLATANIKRIRSNSSEDKKPELDKDTKTFHPLSMPDFS